MLSRSVLAVIGLAFTTVGYAQGTSCSVSDITIKSVRGGFVDKCRGSPCMHMAGIAVLTNNCKEPVGVQVKITGYDGSGAPVATRELWPASVRNIQPGDYEFSLDHYLDYRPSIKRFSVRPIEVRRWR